MRLRLHFKGCGMGPWLVLVPPCFRENVVATCKIVLEIKFQNGARLKKAYFLLFFSHQGKLQEFRQHISHSHT